MLTLAVILAMGIVPQFLVAQGDAGPKKDAVPAEKGDRASPLPDYWGKLAVNEMQRKELNAIRDEYAGRIGELQKQIDALEMERDGKMEAKLTPGQKLRLQELREEAKQRAAAEKAAGGPAAKTDKPKTGN
jgi:hypothetical protein